MIPRVAQRGHSFKGAGDYYLHDKEADTSERVGWTHTHNLPTNDPEKAMKVMAFTAIHSDDIKRQAGTKSTGRKATAGSVYSFSLAWHPEQSPDKKEMIDASMSTLDKLGLTEHQAVIVYHNETKHRHVHVICNLVNPDTGKTARVSHDQLKLSKWAEEYEIKTGQVYCNDRVENNRKREELAQQKSDTQEKTQSAIVKHREKRNIRADLVQSLYERSDSGQAFRSALEENDLTLAKGDRRGFVLVDNNGDIFSLSRQLKGQRASDIKSRLGDIQDLLDAKTLSDERMYFDRDQYEIDRQKEIVDNAIISDKDKRSEDKEEEKDTMRSTAHKPEIFSNDSLFKELDKTRDLGVVRLKYKEKLENFYNFKKMRAEIKEKESKLANSSNVFGWRSSKIKALQNDIQNMKKSLSHAEARYNEQMGGMDKRIENETEEYLKKLYGEKHKVSNKAEIVSKKNNNQKPQTKDAEKRIKDDSDEQSKPIQKADKVKNHKIDPKQIERLKRGKNYKKGPERRI